jgi:membrane protein DedA with SNARE-associated domain
MLEQLGIELVNLIQDYGVLAVIFGAIIEEVIVPIPSPIIPMAAGSILVTAEAIPTALLQIIFIITLPASIASVVSSYFVYGIAYRGGRPIIDRYGKYLDVSLDEVDELEENFGSEKEKYYVAIFRAIPIVPLSVISGAAGLFKMDWKQYGLWSFIGMLPRNFVLAAIGWQLKEGYMSIASQLDLISTITGIFLLGLLGFAIYYKKMKEIYTWILRKI